MRRLNITRFLLLGLLLLSVLMAVVQTAAQADDDDDHEQARRLKDSGQILPLEQIIKAAQAEHRGRVIEVELKTKNGRYVYEVELLDQHGEVWELYFDAASGELIKRKRDD